MEPEANRSNKTTERENTVVELGTQEVCQLKEEWTTESDDTITQEEDQQNTDDCEEIEYER